MTWQQTFREKYGGTDRSSASPGAIEMMIKDIEVMVAESKKV